MTSDPSESTVELLEKVKRGDHGALEVLLERHLPRLRRWASGRLPRHFRDGSDTEDLVQETNIGPDFDDAVALHKVIDAIERSDQTRKQVRID